MDRFPFVVLDRRLDDVRASRFDAERLYRKRPLAQARRCQRHRGLPHMGEEHAYGSKVSRLIDEYDLDGIGSELERRWVGEGAPRQSLRDLADWFNRRLLEVTLSRAGVRTIEGEVENLYRLMTREDVSANARTQGEVKLSRNGIDFESLRGDFVSHQAVYTYLTAHRGVPSPGRKESSGNAVETRKNGILRMQNKLVAVAEGNIEDLESAGRLSIDSFDVTVGVSVHCSGCSRSFGIGELFDRGGCDCGSPS